MVKNVTKDGAIGAKIRSSLSILQQSSKTRGYQHFIARGPAAVWCRVCQSKLLFSKRFLPLNLDRHNLMRKHRDYVWKRATWTELTLTRRDVNSLRDTHRCSAPLSTGETTATPSAQQRCRSRSRAPTSDHAVILGQPRSQIAWPHAATAGALEIEDSGRMAHSATVAGELEALPPEEEAITIAASSSEARATKMQGISSPSEAVPLVAQQILPPIEREGPWKAALGRNRLSEATKAKYRSINGAFMDWARSKHVESFSKDAFMAFQQWYQNPDN